MQQQDLGAARDQRDRGEILYRIILDAFVEPAIGDETVEDHQQRMAVGFGLRHLVNGDDAAAYGPVFDYHRLSDGLRQPRPDRSRHAIERAARRDGNDKADRLARIILSLKGASCGKSRDQPRSKPKAQSEASAD